MKTFVFIAAVTSLIASPSWAQSMDHSLMPGMSMPTVKDAADSKTLKQRKSESTSIPKSGDGHVPSVDQGQMPPAETVAATGQEETVGQEQPPIPPTDHAADIFYDPSVMARSRAQLGMEHGGGTYSKFMLNLGEYQVRDGKDGYRWEGEGWFGGDLNRLVFKSEGEGSVRSGPDAAEAQALYSRAVGPYFDLQAGIRQDFQPRPRRTYATLGFEGVAPYWFETQGALFLSDHGELLGRFESTYDLRLTQRLILQPRIELNVAAQDIPETGIGSGVSNIEVGLRLRFEVKREFAPYIGVSFDRKFGDTARYARSRGEDVSQPSIVLGIRTWF